MVSAIIPTRPQAPYLTQTMWSIAGQLYPNLEAVVVDEGLERSAQRNIGARRANGEILWSTDDDFLFDSNLVEQAVHKIQSGYDAVIVHGTSAGRGWLTETRRRERECYVGSWANEAACIFTRKAFFTVGGFDERLNAFEDGDLQRRLDAAGFKTARISARAYHLGEPLRLVEIVKKYAYYGKNLSDFTAKNPGPRLWSLMPVRLVHLRNMRELGLWFFPMLVLRYVMCASAFIGFLGSIGKRLS